MGANQWTLVTWVMVVLVILIWWRLRIRFIVSERSWLPRELRDAELIYAEHVFRSGGDVPIIAKCDRGYRVKKSGIVLLELKTRRMNRSYLSDVIELSAQRFAIQMQTGECVADYGYVLVQISGRKVKYCHRVELLAAERVVALARRREMIINGNDGPRYACSRGLCAKCKFSKKCID